MMVIDLNDALPLFILNQRAILRLSEDAVNAPRIGLFAAGGLLAVVVDLVDKARTQPAYLYASDVGYLEIAVQRAGRSKVAVRFQLDLTVLAEAETGEQGKIMRPKFFRLRRTLQHEGQHDVLFILIVRRQRPGLIAGETVRRFAFRPKPWPADGHTAANGFAGSKKRFFAQPDNRLFSARLPGDKMRALKRNRSTHLRVAHHNHRQIAQLTLREVRGDLLHHGQRENFILHNRILPVATKKKGDRSRPCCLS